MKLSVAQLTSTDDFGVNLRMIKDLYMRSVSHDSDLVVFPENSMYFRIQSGSQLKSVELDGPDIAELKKLVDEFGTSVMLTTPLKSGSKFSNSTVLFKPNENPRVVYSKVHLFDVDVEGAPPVRESDYFVNGSGPALIDFMGWKIGLSICYDLRFAELYLNYAQKADVILVPSAFLVPTGEAHWHTLLRARAIESQCYVAAPAQAGEHISQIAPDQKRKTYGHSLIVDPWGRILEEIETGLDIRTVELSHGPIEKARRQIPMKAHRRL